MIPRPDLSIIARNLCFMPDLGVMQEAAVVRHDIAAANARGSGYLSNGAWLMAQQRLHREVGAQLRVSREVSFDLEHSNVEEPDFANLPMPAESLEIVWDDPTLPIVLFQKNTQARLMGLYGKHLPELQQVRVNDHVGEVYTLIATIPGTREYTFSALTPERMNAMVRGESVAAYRGQPGTSPLDERDEAAVWFMSALIFKVLLFASIPQFKPQRRAKPVAKAEGGKPHFLNRPPRPMFTVTYLPRQRADAQAASMADEKKGHAFKGRIGTFRTYRHERYKKVRGTTVFLPPVPAPDGTMPKRVFRVIKPTH